jgi:hypothetical protein
MLQVDLTSSDELEIFFEGFYKTQEISIFAWSSILGVGHYPWLHVLICQLHPNSKMDYLVRTI